MHHAFPERLKALEPFWENWYLDKFIGKGSFGIVYRIARRELDGSTSYAALKWIPLPSLDASPETLQYDGYDSTFYHKLAIDLQREIYVMRDLHARNVVAYQDHMNRPYGDIGWEVLIRMELLTPLHTYFADSALTSHDVVRMGIDICRALEACHEENIIHRDIKPDNIFVDVRKSNQPIFKLGDFGIAKQMEMGANTATAVAKGTLNYMAPEVYQGGGHYDNTVDLYSLGLVLYRLLNGWRYAFLPPAPQPIAPADLDNAVLLRMRGDPLPALENIPPQLWQILEKVCAYDPAQRFVSAREMRIALERTLDCSAQPILPSPAKSMQLSPDASDESRTVFIPDAPVRKPHTGFVVVLICAVLLCIGLGGYLWISLRSGVYDLTTSQTASTAVTATWADKGIGPWQLWVSPSGRATGTPMESSSNERTATIDDLIPTTEYLIAVQGNDASTVDTTVKTLAAQPFTEHSTEISSIGLYQYDKSLLESMEVSGIASNLDTLATEVLPGEAIHLPNSPVASHDQDYLLVYTFTCDQTENEKDYHIQTVLRQDDTRIYLDSRHLTRDGAKYVTSYYQALHGLLDEMYLENGRWPTENMAVEVYINGGLLATLPITIEAL